MNGPETTVAAGSSSISEFTYDPGTDTLTITFADGAEYDYFNVPRAVYQSFQRSGSFGQYFQRQIKGRFAYEQR